jgi:hypothetical protein
MHVHASALVRTYTGSIYTYKNVCEQICMCARALAQAHADEEPRRLPLSSYMHPPRK